MNQIYKKENFIIIPVGEDHLVVNIEKVFKEGHINVRRFDIATLLIDLAINKQLPNKSKFVDSLTRISVDKKYIEELQQFKEDSEYVNFKRMMEDVPICRRIHGVIRRVR